MTAPLYSTCVMAVRRKSPKIWPRTRFWFPERYFFHSRPILFLFARIIRFIIPARKRSRAKIRDAESATNSSEHRIILIDEDCFTCYFLFRDPIPFILSLILHSSLFLSSEAPSFPINQDKLFESFPPPDFILLLRPRRCMRTFGLKNTRWIRKFCFGQTFFPLWFLSRAAFSLS